MPQTLKLFDLLRRMDPGLDPERCKLHLAGVAGDGSNPLDEFFAGRFDHWQSFQTRKNFERERVVALLQMDRRDRWLLAGAWDRVDVRKGTPDETSWVYQLAERPEMDSLAGRLVVQYKRVGRSSYRRAETVAEDLVVSELRQERIALSEFPGFADVRIRKSDLDIIVGQQIPSWRGSLSSVGGIYLITDTTLGHLYVGSATGIEGIWSRWCNYAKSGHGGNQLLRKLLKEKGVEHADHFQFGLLEVAAATADKDDLLARESHWKNLLGSRAFGLNAN